MKKPETVKDVKVNNTKPAVIKPVDKGKEPEVTEESKLIKSESKLNT